jgi:hypothetical protein
MVMAALGGIVAALAMILTPVGLIEMLVASSGLSEALPAAAPPLGLKARLLIALFAAIMVMGIILTMRRDVTVAAEAIEEKPRVKRAKGARKMGFAFSKWAALARGRSIESIDGAPPTLRRADAHPDAPARAPIFASRDLNGVDIFARPESGRRGMMAHGAVDAPAIRPMPDFPLPAAPLAGAKADLPQPAFLRPPAPAAEPETGEPAPIVEAKASPAPAPSPAPLPSTHGLTVGQLTERLERGLTHRRRAVPNDGIRVLADMPPATPVPVRATPDTDTDAALRAALCTLRSMTGRAR